MTRSDLWTQKSREGPFHKTYVYIIIYLEWIGEIERKRDRDRQKHRNREIETQRHVHRDRCRDRQ